MLRTGALLIGLLTASALAGPAHDGRKLFEGVEPLTGRIRGHVDALPPTSVRCVNCHAVAATPRATAPAGLAGTESFGPVLDARTLTETRPRRGGPPSAYDADRLCTALRQGLDPSQIYMARNMPLYELTDLQCGQLWAYLTAPRAPAR